MIKTEHIQEAIRRADHFGAVATKHELRFAKYYVGLVLAFIDEAEQRETPVLSTGRNSKGRIMDAVRDA